MKKITVILAVIAIAITSCQGELIPDDEPLENSGSSGNGGGNDGDDEDPRGGKILDEGLVFYNMPGGIDDLDEGTYDTPKTIGRTLAVSDSLVGTANPISGETYVVDEDEKARAKYIIRGPSAVSTSAIAEAGITDAAFLYYNKPLDGEFTLRARVLITAKAGDSSSKGYFFGAFTNEPILGGGGVVTGYKDMPGGTSLGAGLLYRTLDNSIAPAIRPYFKKFADPNSEGLSVPSIWSVGPSGAGDRPETYLNSRQPGWRQERILEVTRSAQKHTAGDNKEYTAVFILKVYDSKSLALLETAYIYDNSVNANLLVGNPVYAGIALLGTSVEFSEMSLWDNANKSGEPIFKTPETTPAYVEVDSVTIGVSRAGGSTNFKLPASQLFANCVRYSVSSVADGQARPISLSTVIAPDYADNLFVDWKIMEIDNTDGKIKIIEIDNANGKIKIIPTDGNEITGWKKADIVVEGSGSVVIMATSRDPGLADHCLELVVN
jgi:hypothetical protein